MSAKLELEANPKVKLNKETLEAALVQIDYLKNLKKDQLTGLCKILDGKVTTEELEEYEKLFRTFDTDEKNEMPVSQLGTYLRILQQIPTDNEIAQLIETINPKKPEEPNEKKTAEKKRDKSSKSPTKEKPSQPEEVVETIDFFKLLLALGLYLRDPSDIAEEIKKAFRVLDRNNQGYIMSADLREFLSKLGDCLTDEEIDEMIALADTESNGQIHYNEFVDMMTNKKPSKKKGKKGKKGKKAKKKK